MPNGDKNDLKKETEPKLPLPGIEKKSMGFISLTSEQKKHLQKIDPADCLSPHERYRQISFVQSIKVSA